MRLNTKELLEQLKWIARFREPKNSIPIIRNVAFQNDAAGLKLTATDLEIGATTYVSAFGTLGYPVAIPVDALLKYLPKVEEPELQISVINANRLTNPPEPLPEGVEGPEDNPARYEPRLRVELQHGEDGLLVIDGMSMESFPELPTAPEPLGTISGLERVLPIVLASVSQEESRFTLNGALLEVENGAAKLAATDGHRLVTAAITSDIAEVRALIPKTALLELKMIAGDGEVTFAQNENHVFFTLGSRQIMSRKLTGNFPDYHRVLPDWQRYIDKSTFGRVQVPVKQLTALIERVATVADARSRAVIVSVSDGKLAVSASISDSGKARGHVTATGAMPESVFMSIRR